MHASSQGLFLSLINLPIHSRDSDQVSRVHHVEFWGLAQATLGKSVAPSVATKVSEFAHGVHRTWIQMTLVIISKMGYTG